MEILSPELAPDHQLSNSLPSSCPPPLPWVMATSGFLLLQGPPRRRQGWCKPFIPALHKAASILFWLLFIINSYNHPYQITKKSLRKKQRWIICRFCFFPPSRPSSFNPCFKNQTQQRFRQVCACIWYKQTKICAFCFIALTPIRQNLSHKTEILWLINTSGDEK